MDKTARTFVLIIAMIALLGLMNLIIEHKIKESYISRAEIANALALASRLKLEVSDYYSEFGQFPRSNFDLGLAEPGEYRGNGLKELVIEDGGVIHLVMAGEPGGKNGHIFLLPDDFTDSLRREWLCLTPTYRAIAEYAPQCSYKPVEGW